jgi:hypothetical protein
VPLIIDTLLNTPLVPVDGLRLAFRLRVHDTVRATISTGALRIGGDAPDGLVRVGGAPAARVVDLFDRESRVFVATTTSASDGTYAFTGLAARTEGYDVVIRGVVSSGERDVIVPGMQPG